MHAVPGASLEAAGLSVGTPGKGRACWLAMGYLLAEERADYLAFFDADVVNFSREMLARLVLPALDPIVDFDFVKAYYARFSDRLHGRVTRLFVSPLLAAFPRLIGQDPYIRYLASFRYPLSGEFAVQRDLASRMRLPSDWGLEIVTLFEALRHRAPVRICQVEIADRYEHKHQEPLGRRPGARPQPDGARRRDRTCCARSRRPAWCCRPDCSTACWRPISGKPRTPSPTATPWPPSTA